MTGRRRLDPELRRVFGEVVRELREELGIRQYVAAKRAGFPESTKWSIIESGLRAVSVDDLWSIAFALELPPSDLVRRIEARIVRERNEDAKPSDAEAEGAEDDEDDA